MKEKYSQLKERIGNKLICCIMDGAVNGVKTAFMLLKVMIPIYVIVVIMKYSPIMSGLEELAAPAMGLFRLPSEGVVPIVAGLFSDEYGVLAAAQGFNFTTAAFTTIVMIGAVAHGLPVEAGIAAKIGMNPWVVIAYRLILAVIVGVLVGWIGGMFL